MNTALSLATFAYFLGMLKYLLYLGMRRELLYKLAGLMIALGFLAETIGLVQLARATGHGPYQSPFEYCLFLAWAIFGVLLVAVGYFRIKALGAFMAPLGFFFMLLAFFYYADEAKGETVREYWLTLHRTLSTLSFGAFTLIFAAGVMYLIQERQLKAKNFGGWYHRLPSLNILDDANRIGLIIGFPVVTIGAAAAGVFSLQKYGSIMKIDFSTTLLLVGWGAYAMLVAGRYWLGWRGRRAALIGVSAFGLVLSSLILHVR